MEKFITWDMLKTYTTICSDSFYGCRVYKKFKNI